MSPNELRFFVGRIPGLSVGADSQTVFLPPDQATVSSVHRLQLKRLAYR